MASSELEVQDSVADFYVNKRYKGLGLEYHKSVIKEIMRDAYGRILDVGCGTGILHELYPNLDIVGIDISSGMLRHHKGPHVQGSADNMPFKDNYFDTVVCRSVLHHLPDARAGLEEIRRVLKPGGHFVCWETNKSWLAEAVRRKTQHGDHFSDYHTSFANLGQLVGDVLGSAGLNASYGGYLAYPLLGFPDILDFSRWVGFASRFLIRFDSIVSKLPIINRLGFFVLIRARKDENIINQPTNE